MKGEGNPFKGSRIAIKFGELLLPEVLDRFEEWLEDKCQSMRPGDADSFSYEGEYRIPGIRGKLRLTAELEGLE